MARMSRPEPPMVQIPGGVVDLRDDRLGTRWQVGVTSFLLGAYPVTAAQFDPGASDYRPLTNVSWLDSIDLCNRLSTEAGHIPAYVRNPGSDDVSCDWTADGYRLPTDAEWQYACKAGTSGYRYGPIDDIAWYAGTSGGRIHDVGGKAPNPWGLFDMLGNVWEWCWDLYDENVYGEYRILRGGGWADEARSCGASVRRRSHPTFRIDDLGLRVARSTPATGRGESSSAV
jgi:formylglycine-generating enzyme required for sulfatase activity